MSSFIEKIVDGLAVAVAVTGFVAGGLATTMGSNFGPEMQSFRSVRTAHGVGLGLSQRKRAAVSPRLGTIPHSSGTDYVNRRAFEPTAANLPNRGTRME